MPASPNRSSEDKAKVRAAMTRAAAELLTEEGYDGVTLAKVGKQVGFTTTNVYRYFESKDDLIYAAVEDAFVAFGARLEQAKQSTPDPLERIHSLGRAYLEFAADHPVAYHLMFVDETDFGEREIPGVDKLRYLTEAVAEGVTLGQVRNSDVTAMADTLWALLHGVVTLARTMPFIDEARKEAMVAEAFKVVSLSLPPE